MELCCCLNGYTIGINRKVIVVLQRIKKIRQFLKRANRVYPIGLFYILVVTRYIVGHSSWAYVIYVKFEYTYILL